MHGMDWQWKEWPEIVCWGSAQPGVFKYIHISMPSRSDTVDLILYWRNESRKCCEIFIIFCFVCCCLSLFTMEVFFSLFIFHFLSSQTFDDINSNSSCKLSRFDGLLFVCLSCNFAMSNVCEKTKMDCWMAFGGRFFLVVVVWLMVRNNIFENE